MKKKSLFLGLLFAGASLLALSSCTGKKKPVEPANTPKTTDIVSTPKDDTDNKPTEQTIIDTPVDTTPVVPTVTDKPVDTTPVVPTLTDTPIESIEIFEKHTVKFVVDGIETTKEYNCGDVLGDIEEPTTSNSNDLYEFTNKFNGWYDQNDALYDETTKIEEDVTLTAKFEITSIKLNSKVTKSNDVTDLVNDKYLTDVLASSNYDIITLFSFYKGFNALTFSFGGEKIKQVGYGENIFIDYVNTNDKFVDSYIYLPNVLKNKTTNKYQLKYDGTKFIYTINGISLIYGLDGLITQIDDYYAVYDLIDDKKPNVQFNKNATKYELYDVEDPNVIYSAFFDKGNWYFSTKDESIIILLELLFSNPKELVKMYQSLFSAELIELYKENNYLYYKFESKGFSSIVKIDEDGYIRTIDFENPKTGEAKSFVSYPVIDTVEISEVEFVNKVFNPTKQNVGHINFGSETETSYESGDIYIIDGKVELVGEFDKYIAGYLIPQNKVKNIFELIKFGKTTFYYDAKRELYIAESVKNKENVVISFDALGQIAYFDINVTGNQSSINLRSEFGEFVPIKLHDYNENRLVYTKLGELFTYTPEKIVVDEYELTRVVLAFNGYYLDKNYNQQFVQEKDIIKGPIELYVRYVEKREFGYKIHNNPRDIDDYVIDYFEKDNPVINLPDTNINGYIFDGWFADYKFKEPIDPKNTYKEYFAKYIPETYENYLILGSGKNIDIDYSLPVIESIDDFEYVGCIGIIGSVNKTIYEKEFSTELAASSIIKFDINDGASVKFIASSSVNKNLVRLFVKKEVHPIEPLTSKFYYIENGKIIRCINNQIPQEGVDYYVIENEYEPANGIINFSLNNLKQNTYFITNVDSIQLSLLEINYE